MDVDVLIRGRGPVGCALALALRDSGLRIAMPESGAPPGSVRAASFRPIALSYASRLILERLGAWEGLEATPIGTVLVSQQSGFGRTRLDASDAGVPALGYVVDYAALGALLRAKTETLATREEAAARCVVHAEGLSAEAEEKRYDQHAIVAVVRFDRPSGTVAHERFTPQGPLALLPMAGRHALVWSMRPERAHALATADEPDFLRALAEAAGRRAGVPVAAEGRAIQPLSLRVRPARIGPRAVYVGNAAQTLHPVAGQGLNLGLRDAWDLAQVLRGTEDPGDPSVLSRYARTRSLDAQATIRVTDLLAAGFAGGGRVSRAARGLALAALDVLPGPRRFFARRMIYGPSALP
jgi:2-octaprenyl-6-methoxyphenol hydroxylase